MSFVKDLDTPLLRLSPTDVFTARDAVNGVHAFGQIGAGKSSGLKILAGAYLRAGFGGIVTIAKHTDIEAWRGYCSANGRSRSLVEFNENEGFNFLQYEMAQHGMEGTGTVVECVMRVLEAAKRASSGSSQTGGDPFWLDGSKQFLRYTLPPLYAATGTLTITDIIRFISSAPTSLKEVEDPKWRRESFMFQMMDKARTSAVVPMSHESMEDLMRFWTYEFVAIPEKTRGNIVISITAILDRFRHGRLKRAFCEKTTIVPEMTFHGSVLLLCMPALTWNEDGIIAQIIFKYFWMRSVLKRNSLAKKHRERFVFGWSDEAQMTVDSGDGAFLGLARDSRCCMTYLTQSLPTYYSKMGGSTPREDAEALVGKFTTHIFFANLCPATNEWATRTVGKTLVRRGNYSAGTSKGTNYGMNSGRNESTGSSHSYGHSGSSGGGFGSSNSSHNSGGGSNNGEGSNWGANRGRSDTDNESRGYSESMENQIEPGSFARDLKTGGKQNGNRVTAYWFQSARIFKESGTNFLLETFAQ